VTVVGSVADQHDIVHVSALNEYLYCPRRFYYQRYHDEIGSPYELVDGRSKHENAAHRGDWINERYLCDTALGLHGKVDVIESSDDVLTPIERKRAESGGYYTNDEIQLAGYCMLLSNAIGEPINFGYIYLYSTDQRHSIRITDDHRQAVTKIIDRIQSMSVENIPPLTNNPDKCEACSAREYCMPEETAILEPEKARGTGWEDHA
jgi:CRISPR-associated exonuclease Cas4